jgi:hypothetical protein
VRQGLFIGICATQTHLSLRAKKLPVSNSRKHPFSKLIQAGDRVQIIHQVGKCAVGRVTPKDSASFIYVARFRNFTAYAKYREDIPLALAELRQKDRAEVAHNAELLTYADFRREFPNWSDAALTSFYVLHGLSPSEPYKRQQLRQAVTAKRLPSYNIWLSAIQTAAPMST